MAISNKPANRYQPMTDYLEAMIAGGHFSCGCRLPSLRTLCEEFKLSRGTAARGLEHLRDRGLVELRQGSGAYVCRKNGRAAAANGRKIAVFSEHCNSSESYCAHIILGIQKLAEETGTTLNLHLKRYESTHLSDLQEAAAEADALLLVGAYDLFLHGLPERRPVVGVDMQNSFGLASLIGFDTRLAAELAADFFIKRKFRRARVITFPIPLYRFRGELFSLAFQALGGEVETTFTCDAYDAKLLTPDFYRRQLPLFDDPDCAYFFVSGTECNRVMHIYRELHGRDLAAERTVLSLDGKSRLIPGYLPVNTIGPDYAEIGEIAFNECLRRIENPGARPRRIEASCNLILAN